MKKAIAIVGVSMPNEAVEALREDFHVIILPQDNTIAPEVSSHPDMILTIFDGKIFCHESYAMANSDTLAKLSAESGLEVIPCQGERCAKYPEDVEFNVLTMGDTLLGRMDSMAEKLKEYPTVNTRQGYAGCTSLFAAGHVISADPSILKSANASNIPNIQVSGEGILLVGYDKGFIGGACGVFEDEVYICGNPDSCPAGASLKDVCEKLGLKLIPLCDGSVHDVGGIKFVPFSIEK